MLPSIFGESLFDRFFDNAFPAGFFQGRRSPAAKPESHFMQTDVREKEKEYELAVDLPGFKKEDINLELQDGYLTITAAKNLDKEEKEEEGRYIRQERYSGRCSRSFYVGEVKADEVSAKYQDGILRLTVPKKEQEKLDTAHRIAIE